MPRPSTSIATRTGDGSRGTSWTGPLSPRLARLLPGQAGGPKRENRRAGLILVGLQPLAGPLELPVHLLHLLADPLELDLHVDDHLHAGEVDAPLRQILDLLQLLYVAVRVAPRVPRRPGRM